MFSDVGPLELVTLGILAVLLFGPDKLPEVIQNVVGFIRKVKEFSDSAKQEIRSELGPEFEDFEFDDLNPRTLVRKQLMDNEALGFDEIRSAFDLGQEMTDVADAVRQGQGGGDEGGSSAPVSLLKSGTAAVPPEHPRFDRDMT
ncbi:sec-independent translocase [Streptomyces sp. WG7]|uniref:sec-independent translocase n=1 Tax=Streptomyces sp. WG7 TaxID=3417650 RepID=UPI003CEE9D40